MKLFVGYQLCRDETFLNGIIESKDKIDEVYFSWSSMPSGRSQVGAMQDLFPWEAASKQQAELKRIASAGIGLNLLLNANCYGAQSLARSFFQSTGDLIDYLKTDMNLVSVTTVSPVIGRFVKENFADLEVRASVNMEIGTEEGMAYLADSFDSFYLKRELNRDIPAIKKLRRWCDDNGKKLDMLANSGCLNNCSARQFHDNLVAHEHEIAMMDNAFIFHSACRTFLTRNENKADIIRLSNWVRPEDLHRYEGLVDGVKLASRVSPCPLQVLRAYTDESYSGNILELMEPNHADIYYPTVVENSLFPDDYFDKRHNCSHNCSECGYCRRVFNEVKCTLTDTMIDTNDFQEEN